ncbi:MAG: HAMP domain-containing histidine kinase, partial [Woeseiaceae bacterium]|nr:HAMP domain-containing histidine kinase [Woeseiaceae bacterium]
MTTDMPGTGVFKAFDLRRLRLLILLLFIALAVPTGALIWQAFGQLKWEAFYQHRGLAEELTARIDADLGERIRATEARSFDDFSFLVLSGDPAANFLQRSPLSEYPVPQDLPGVIGYFQVDADGSFRTPLLPPAGAAADKLGILPEELEQRRILASEIHRVLADNRLVRDVADASEVILDTGRRDETEVESAPESVAVAAESERQVAKRKDGYSQQVFDRLNSPVQAPAAGAMSNAVAESDTREPAAGYGKVADLKLDQSLQKKSESLERKSSFDDDFPSREIHAAGAESPAVVRSRRLEESVLPGASALPQSQKPEAASEVAGMASANEALVTTFASEIDPYEFSLLESGHLVLFRKVWRNGERLIQGLLIDSDTFLSQAVESEFRTASLSDMSDLVIGYQDDVMRVVRGTESGTYPVNPAELQGTLLYQRPLSAPLDGLELIFSINRLPAGPGAEVLRWTTVIIAIVFVAGFYLVYRLGVGQLRLARQQQDFVSAVSHELKTPLTSIRMYGEMLTQGWVSEDKRRQYYEYIQDESERLSRLISNVLQLAKITRSEARPELKQRNVGELMSQIESKVGAQVQRAGFSLRLLKNPVDDQALVMIDDDSFAQIMINLVDNAIKFSKNAENKSIDIGCNRAGDDSVVFTVRDYGPGIARGQLKKIFELFYRAESELTRETVGTGIGLAIVHQLATRMQGKVDVLNKDPGAEFRLQLP